MNQNRYLILRAIQTVFLIWIAITVLFLFFRLLPGDFTTVMMGQGASEEAVNRFEENWGLNDPLYIQYFRYLVNLLSFDAGTSLQYRIPVWEFVSPRVFNSLILIVPGITVGYILGTGFGLLTGISRGTIVEKYGVIPFIAAGGIPSFVTAIFIVIIFSSTLGLFPPSGLVSIQTAQQFDNQEWWAIYFTGDFLRHYILPFTAVLTRYIFFPTLIMRTSVVETLQKDFIEYYRTVGISRSSRFRQLIRHSILPVITLYPISMTRAIGGLVLIEVVFNWPGIGFTLIEAVFARDIPVVQFIFVLTAIYIILANFVVDILYSYLDPRIELGS